MTQPISGNGQTRTKMHLVDGSRSHEEVRHYLGEVEALAREARLSKDLDIACGALELLLNRAPATIRELLRSK